MDHDRYQDYMHAVTTSWNSIHVQAVRPFNYKPTLVANSNDWSNDETTYYCSLSCLLWLGCSSRLQEQIFSSHTFQKTLKPIIKSKHSLYINVCTTTTREEEVRGKITGLNFHSYSLNSKDSLPSEKCTVLQ